MIITFVELTTRMPCDSTTIISSIDKRSCHHTACYYVGLASYDSAQSSALFYNSNFIKSNMNINLTCAIQTYLWKISVIIRVDLTTENALNRANPTFARMMLNDTFQRIEQVKSHRNRFI